MATKKNTDRFVLSASGMRNIHTAPLRSQRQKEAAKRTSRKGKSNGR